MRRFGLALIITLAPATAWAQPEEPPVPSSEELAEERPDETSGYAAADDGDAGDVEPTPVEMSAAPAEKEAAAGPSSAGPASAGPASSGPPLAPGPTAGPDEDEDEAQDEAQMKWPDYFAAGLVTMGAGIGLGVGGAVVTAEGQIKDALALGVFTTLAFGTGVPLALLGGMDAEPEDSTLAYAGTFAATAGAITAGLGGVIWMRREATHQRYKDLPPDPEDPSRGDPADLTTPLLLVGVGAAAVVGGLITWSIGAGHRDDEGDESSEEARVWVTPGLGSVAIEGRF